MLLDGVSLVLVSRALGPQPPAWATAPFFWALAWSVQLLSFVFPNHTPGDRGPSIAAIAGGALIDLVLLSIVIDWVYRKRRGAARDADRGA